MVRKVIIYLPLAMAAVSLAALVAVPLVAFADPGLQSTKPSITLSPATARPNQAVTVTGKSFTPGGGATVSSISIGNSLIPVEKINFGAAVDVDSGGNFVANVVVPLDSATLTPGSYSVTVTDSAGIKASASLTIPAPTLSVSPVSSRVGSAITATGANFPVNNGGFGADSPPAITIEYEVNGATLSSVATVFPDSSGAFAATFEVPMDAPVPSTDNIVRALVNGVSAATAKHSVPNPTLVLTPAQGAPGTEVNLTGSNFKPFSTVTALTLGGLDVVSLSNLHTDAAGSLTVNFIVPETYGGAQPVLVQAGGSRYTTAFQVEASLATAEPVLPESVSPAAALRPLKDNLVRAFRFDNATKEWAFYDPRPTFADANTLTELVEGQAYWVEVKTDQTAILGSRILTFVEGWNLIPW